MRVAILVALIALAALAGDLKLRSRVELFRGSGEWSEVEPWRKFDATRTAVVICDMWNKHWCKGASDRVDAMAPKMDAFLKKLRSRGVLIVHAPSDTMEFYKDAPQRKAILALPSVAPPEPLALADPPLPIDDKDGGCDTGETTYKAWSRQHPAIEIDTRDLVSDRGAEIYNAIRARGIETLLIMGVHTNMCILNRTFAIKQMTKWGVRCVLVRDFTDAMYDPKDRPFVSHAEGTELVIRHIEKHWAPTARSVDVLRALE